MPRKEAKSRFVLLFRTHLSYNSLVSIRTQNTGFTPGAVPDLTSTPSDSSPAKKTEKSINWNQDGVFCIPKYESCLTPNPKLIPSLWNPPSTSKLTPKK